jgi:3-hydroxyacyl-CoA dehydrogenase
MHSSRERLDSRTNLLVRRVAVLGAGRLGSQIAALFANNGVGCDLLDLSSRGHRRSLVAEEARESLLSLDPSPMASREALELIRVGNISDDLSRLEEADWVIEAVAEKLHVKRQLWGELAPYLRRSIINSTATTAIPIAYIASALPYNLQERFLGTQFFNPPRYLKLVEVVPHKGTSPGVIADTRRVAERVLGKSIIVAGDAPGFVVNRIGCYSFIVTMRAMEEFGLTLEDVDDITGSAMGRPRSATFRSLDLIGLDVFTGGFAIAYAPAYRTPGITGPSRRRTTYEA